MADHNTSTRRRRPYSVESIHRALQHHEVTGAVHSVSPPGGGRSKWRIVIDGYAEPLELTTREAWALCNGLAAGERRYGIVNS
jgi:hypothetical protein